MKVLLLVQKDQRTQFGTLYDGISERCDLDLRRLHSDEQADLAGYFKQHVDTQQYDRIVFFLRFKKEIRQVAFIRTVPNLVILEYDAWQNYYPNSKYHGKFSRHYRALPWARVLVSGATLCDRLQREGHQAVFIPKGYNDKLLRNFNQPRHTELGFLGNIEHNTYIKRKRFLTQAKQDLGLVVKLTQSGEEYLAALNDIRFFISADIDFGENMIKNFEAMACGCIVFAYDQGDKENSALQFRDMENIVLYRTLEEVKNKLNILRNDPTLADSIALNGQQLAEQHYGFTHLGHRIVEALEPPLSTPQPTSGLDKIRYFLRR